MNFRLILSIVGIFIGGFLILASLNKTEIQADSNIASKEVLRQDAFKLSSQNINLNDQNAQSVNNPEKPYLPKYNEKDLIDQRFYIGNQKVNNEILQLINNVKNNNVNQDGAPYYFDPYKKPEQNNIPNNEISGGVGGSPNVWPKVSPNPPSARGLAGACGYNQIQGEQCGGGSYPWLPIGSCPYQTPWAYDSCGGNPPEYVGGDPQEPMVPPSRRTRYSMGEEPRDYTPACSAVATCGPPCVCAPAVINCPQRMIKTRCIDPVSGSPCIPDACNVCCSPCGWIWDSVTGKCACSGSCGGTSPPVPEEKEDKSLTCILEVQDNIPIKSKCSVENRTTGQTLKEEFDPYFSDEKKFIEFVKKFIENNKIDYNLEKVTQLFTVFFKDYPEISERVTQLLKEASRPGGQITLL